MHARRLYLLMLFLILGAMKRTGGNPVLGCCAESGDYGLSPNIAAKVCSGGTWTGPASMARTMLPPKNALSIA